MPGLIKKNPGKSAARAKNKAARQEKRTDRKKTKREGKGKGLLGKVRAKKKSY